MHCVDKIVYGHLELDSEYPFVYEVRGMRGHDVYSEDLFCVIVDDQF